MTPPLLATVGWARRALPGSWCPETGVVIAVQANADTFAQIHDVVTSLAAAALT
jgi:hypothetical protein